MATNVYSLVRHTAGWVVLACILFTGTVYYAASELQILILTLNGQFTPVPASQPVGSYVSTSLHVLPQIFFSYLLILSGLVAADLSTVQVLRGKLHDNSKASPVLASTGSSQIR